VIIQYQTNFERAPGMIESVTPLLEKDGKWEGVRLLRQPR